MNLQSSTQHLGRYVNETFYFCGGEIKTFYGINTSEIQDGATTILPTKDGRKVLVWANRIDYILIDSKERIVSNEKSEFRIFHFSSGRKVTFEILPHTIKDGTFTKMMLKDGRMLMVNTKNVDCIEVFKEV